MNVSAATDGLPCACGQCGATTQGKDGICVNCFLREGLGNAETSVELFQRTLREDEIPEKAWRLGNYEILRELGRGGMGVVLLARRADAEYEKRVAIKLIKRGMDSDTVLKHFRAERQILAGFDHPNIARLFDGGTTQDGLPYFVMEYVDGSPIDEYCDRHALSLGERLTLFRQVCSAVSYAHRHLVVHRDIKRTNILITAEGIPKLLDFGIAKILQQNDGAQSLATITGIRLMTPEYASPEQVRGDAVTTATDVYSLGVVLYELLTGRLPYRFTTSGSRDMEQAITGQEPVRPSTAVCDTDSKTTVAIRKSLRGDLDNIVLMALRKEPERRYASVEQFSEDIRRHLEALPVLARQDTVGYRMGKFIGRNKTAMAALALVFLSMLIGIIATTWEARRARVQERIAKSQEAAAKTEKARAERRFADVRQLARSLLFDYHDAIKDLPGATRVRERLVKDALASLDRLGEDAHGDPALQGELAAAYERVGDVRGQAYVGGNLGDRAGALDSYGKAVRIREILMTNSPRDIENRRALAGLHKKIGEALEDTADAQRGLEHLEKGVDICISLVADQPNNPEIKAQLARLYNAIGLILEDRSDMAGASGNHRKALAIWQQLLTEDPENLSLRRGISVSYENIGRVLALTGEIKAALENNARAMALREELFARDPNNADYRRILSISYQNNGDYLAMLKDNAGAVENFRKKLALDEKSYATDRANAQAREDLGYTCRRLGELLGNTGNYSQALPFDQRAVELDKENMAADPQNLSLRLGTANAEANLGEARARTGDAADARDDCEQALALLESTPDDPDNASQRSLRAHAFTKLGDAYVVLAEVQSSTKSRQIARQSYQHALGIMHEDSNRGLLNADDEAEMQQVTVKLADCDRNAAK